MLAASASSKDTQLILPSSSFNQNTRLFHFAGIEPAPSAKSETLSKTFNLLFFCDNRFVGEGWFDKPQER